MSYYCPVKFQLNTTKVQDGYGKEGIRVIPFIEKNGPEISVEGLKENATVDGQVNILVNAYGSGDQLKLMVEGSETPRSAPARAWALMVAFVAWVAFYITTSLLP